MSRPDCRDRLHVGLLRIVGGLNSRLCRGPKRCDRRWANDQYNRLPDLADNLGRRQVSVIAAGGTAATWASKGSDRVDPYCFRAGCRPGPRWNCSQSEPAGRKPHWRRDLGHRAGSKAAGGAARVAAGGQRLLPRSSIQPLPTPRTHSMSCGRPPIHSDYRFTF